MLIYFSSFTLSFTGTMDSYYSQIFGSEIMLLIKKTRLEIFKYDVLRAIFFATIVFTTLFLFIKNKISKTKLQTPKSFDKSEMGINWQPSDDVVEILLKAEISEDFIHNLIPEFRVYWMEKPGIHVSYNSKFIEYARFKWAQYTAEVDTRTKPFVIDDSWQPSDECREVLSLSGISEDFANEKILDFILYWKQDGRAFNTWDVKFLNHVKTCWNKEVEKIKKEPKINIDFYEAEEKPKSKKSNLNLKKYRKKYNI